VIKKATGAFLRPLGKKTAGGMHLLLFVKSIGNATAKRTHAGQTTSQALKALAAR
jgi:hypothetical protein